MSTSGGSVDAKLTAPLELPAVAGKPLTTQGGNTLDDGSGDMVVAGELIGPSLFVVTSPGRAVVAGGYLMDSSGVDFLPNGVIHVRNDVNVVTSVLNDGAGNISANHINAAPTAPALPANPPVSGTVYQNTTGGPITVVIPVTATAIGGSAQLALGSTNAPPAWGGAEQIGVSGELHNVSVMVPNNWYWSVTVVNATIGTASVLGL